MAETAFTVNSPETVKLWSKKLHVESLKKTYIKKFIGKSQNSLIQEVTDLKKAAGDRVRIQLNTLLKGEGVQGDDILEGNEESLEFYYDDIVINQIRHAASAGGKMSQQRVLHNMRNICMDKLSDWMAQRYDTAFFLQAGGLTTNASVSDANGEVYNPGRTIYTGNNATTAPTGGRHFWSEDGTTADEGLDSTGDNMSLSLIDDLVTAAKLASPVINPIRLDGDDYYVLFLHPRQVRDLRQDASTAGNWFDIQKAALQGGQVSDNPIFTGALGVYNGVVLHESSRVPQGQNSSTGAYLPLVRRAIFGGAQAFCMAFGQGDSIGSMNWAEERRDYGNMLGVAAGSIYGLKKTVHTTEDFGVQVLSTYAAV